jgi:hypothetical protein
VLAATSPSPDGIQLGPAHRAYGHDNGTVVYAGACDEAQQPLPQLRQLLYPVGGPDFTESVVIDDVQWAGIADVDGDALLDLVFAPLGAETFAWSPGDNEGSFGAPVPADLPALDVRGNNVRAVDMDGDGREELLRGWVLVDAEPPQLFYDRLWLGPCE